MEKRSLRKVWNKVKNIRPWYFLALALIFGVISITALRSNNLTMLRLREAVTTADRQDGDIEGALRNLREYIYGHMNTNLSGGDNTIKPPVQLKYEYERLVAAAQQKANAANKDLDARAQAYCAARYSDTASNGPQANCIVEYSQQHRVEPSSIPDGLYKFDFVSPAWTPDVAGWSLVATSFCFIIFVFLFLVDRWILGQINE